MSSPPASARIEASPHSTFPKLSYTVWQGEGGLGFSPLAAPGFETLLQATTCPVAELEVLGCDCEVCRLWAKAPKMQVCPLNARDDKVLGGGAARGKMKEPVRESPCGGEPPTRSTCPTLSEQEITFCCV